VFKQKSGYDAHVTKKIDCAKSSGLSDVIDAKVEEKVKEVIRSALPKPEVTKETLHSFFEDLHNLLWNKAGFSPERALDHMTFFFAYRLIEKQADSLGLPQECRWSYLVSLKDENDLDLAIKQGVTSFRLKPQTKPFFKPHDIKKAELVYEIIQHINRIPMKTLEETDTLGDIFEYMLSRGMSTMSDEGQYFTNRAICRLAFKLTFEIKKSLRRDDGTLCTFGDWFCGTGGFAAEYVRGVKENLADIDWKKDSSSIYCQDMSVSSVTTTLLNMLIQTGVPFGSDKIRDANSFADPITTGAAAPYPGLTLDYCFMNPPYSGDKNKGKEYKFVYAKKAKGLDGKLTKKYFVNQEIQSIGVEDDDKVSAGVQLAMATLSSDGGICAIVLPQGFFFGASKKCVELRKKIAEEYKIHCVVDIASGAFVNTGTKTSMMVFQRGVGPTEKVSFIGIDEKPLVEATLDDLRKKNYSLNYKQYLAQDAVEVEGFEMVKLGDISKKLATRGKHSAKDTIENGKYSLFSSSINEIYKLATFDYSETCCIINSTNASGNAVVNLGREFSVTSDTFVFKCDDDITTKYLQLYLSNNLQVVKDQFQGANHKHPTWDRLASITAPLPSLERQAQIVEAIDGWASLAQHEEQALKMLEKQVMFQVKEMGRGQALVKLGGIATFTFGYGIKSEDFGESGLPIIKTKNFKDNGVSIISSNPRSNKKYDDKYLIKKGDLLMVVDGACGDSAIWLENENGWLNQHVAKLHIENETTRMYVAFVMKGDMFKEYIQSNIVITTIPHMQRDVAKNFEIPLPPLTEQQTLQSEFDEIRHKHAKLAEYKAKAQAAIQRLIPGATPSESKTEPALVADTDSSSSISDSLSVASSSDDIIQLV
jgi:type I restriction-modification system DNA methylase subunit